MTAPLRSDIDFHVQQVLLSLQGMPVPRTETWHLRPEVAEAHRLLIDQVVESEMAFPDRFSGRGIVTCGGGSIYFAAVWIMIDVLRKLGCSLPVEVWHLGWEEMDKTMRSLLVSLGDVQVIDAHEVCGNLPSSYRPRLLKGWESKAFAIEHSRFAEVLYLDADQVPVADPEYLFETKEYQETGSLFWPDMPNQWGLDITEQAFRTMRLSIPGRTRNPAHVRPTDYRPFETGQMLIDKHRTWKALQLTRHICDHSDYWWSGQPWLIYGDKSAFYLAWERLRLPYFLARDCDYIGDHQGGGFLQYDPQGKLLFQHRCQPDQKKWSLHGDNFHPEDFQKVDEIEAGLALLRERWIGHPYDVRDNTVSEDGLMRRTAGEWKLMTLGLQEHLKLSAEGTVEGSSRLTHWTIRMMDGQPCVILSDKVKGKHRLKLTAEGDWMDKENRLSRASSESASWLAAPQSETRHSIWKEIMNEDHHRLPHYWRAEDVVIDAGAHIGVLSVRLLNQGVGKVVCVEPHPENLPSLKRNLDWYGDRAEIIPKALWSLDDEKTLKLGTIQGKGRWASASVTHSDRIPIYEVEPISLNKVIEHAVGEGTVRLLKLDCEGAEIPALLDCQRWSQIEELVCECHLNFPGAEEQYQKLKRSLIQHGFALHESMRDEQWGMLWAKRQHYKRFLLLSSPRSGTHLLRSLLDSHPQICCHTELLNPDHSLLDPEIRATDILQRDIWRGYSFSIKNVGFCLHRSGARICPAEGLWEQLEQDSDLAIISLTRTNLLKRYLSHLKISGHPYGPYLFSPEELARDFEDQEQTQHAFNKRFASHEVFSLTYEELTSQPSRTMQNLLQFLEVEPLQLHPGTKRNPRKRLQDEIMNLSELQHAFAGTKWESFFYEDEENIERNKQVA